MPPHVLRNDQGGAQTRDGIGDVGPEVSFIVGAFPISGMREGLAGIAAGEDVHRLHGRPVHGGDVAVVGDVGPVVGKDRRRVLVELDVPRDARAVVGGDGDVEAAVATEQTADSHRSPAMTLRMRSCSSMRPRR